MSEPLKLVLIAADPEVCARSERAGVGRIMVDLERMGKLERQQFRDTWISKHRIEDIAPVAAALSTSELMVRVNPMYDGTQAEIDTAIGEGAQLIMLPMFCTIGEIDEAARIIDGRAGFVPLIETHEALAMAEDVINHPGVGEVFVGLNDLHLSLELDFMFEPLANGMLDAACAAFAASGKPYGFGGIARIGEGDLPAELILREHVRLGSTRVNLSRSFVVDTIAGAQGAAPGSIRAEVRRLFDVYEQALRASPQEMEENRLVVRNQVRQIVADMSNAE